MKKLKIYIDNSYVRIVEIVSACVGLTSSIGSFFDQSLIPKLINISEPMIINVIYFQCICLIVVWTSNINEWLECRNKGHKINLRHVFLPEFRKEVLLSFLGRNFIALLLLSMIYSFPQTFLTVYPDLNSSGLLLYLLASIVVLSWYITDFRDVNEYIISH